jgi:dTDP-4-dehydrorhamnose 3,5-epimerase-like enzyme
MKKSAILTDVIPSIETLGGSIKKIANCGLHPNLLKGELYTTTICYGVIRAWKRHTRNDTLLTIIDGSIKIVTSENQIFKPYFLNCESTSQQVYIPAGVLFGFQGMSNEAARILSLSSGIYEENEVDRFEIEEVAYKW